jgi:PAS domain S-box-containing protein
LAKKTDTDDRLKLRAEAEARFARDSGHVGSGPPTSELLHELQVHQIELEMQNEELRRTQVALEVSRDRYVDLYDFAPIGYFTVSDAGLIEDANLTAAALLGVDRAKLRGRRFAAFVIPESVANWGSLLSEVRSDAEPHSCDLALQRSAGPVFAGHVSCQRSGVVGDGGTMRVVLTDISRRKHAEDALRDGEERMRSIVTSMAEGVVVQGTSGRILTCNTAAERILGLSRAQIEGRTSLDPGWKSIREDGSPFPGSEHPSMSTLRNGIPLSNVLMGIHKPDGTLTWISISTEPLRAAPTTAPYAVVATFADVTELRRASAQIGEIKERLSFVIDGSNDGFWDWDVPTGRVKFSRRWASMLGYDLDELEPHVSTWKWMVHPDDLGSVTATVEAHLRGESDLYECEQRVRHKDGRWVWILDRGKVVERDAYGGPVRMAGTHTDITARKLVEEALRASESRFRLLANVTAIGIFQTGAQGQILFVNSTYLALTGLSEEEAHGPDGNRAIHPEDRERVVREWQEAVSAGIGFSAEYRHLLPDGSVNWVRMFGRPFLDGAGAVAGYVGALVDITEPRALQAQLALASRLAAMGTLVTGVAHEINNPLSAELADQGVALEVVREVRARLGDGSPLDRKAEVRLLDGVVEALEDAQESGQRISRIVKDLTAFGRPDTGRTRVRMIDVVNGALRWLPAAVARTARIQVEDGGAPDVVASSGQIEQVLVNLAVNAAFATPEGQRDTVIVRIGPGDRGMARLEVIDHGTGIEPAILDRVFEPFFTTHAVGAGKGMGLGLAISHTIVTAHGGSLTVTSVVGKGSTFRLELPAAVEDAG